MAPSTGSIPTLRRELAQSAADPFQIAAEALQRCDLMAAEIKRLQNLLTPAQPDRQHLT
jgi:hypothetical protein